jgi:hypothetical protein
VYKRPPPKKAPKSSRPTKRAKSSSEEAPPGPTPAGVGSPTAASENMDIDIEGDAPATPTTPSVVSTSTLAASGSGTTRPPPPQRSRSQQDVASSSQPKRRRRAVVLSDDSDDDFDASKADAAEPQDEEEDMSRKQSVPSRASSPPAKTTDKSTAGPSRSANAILSARIPKKKRTADKDDKPVLMKNESKTTTSSPASASPAGSVLSIADATKSTPVQPVRKKLPPIKKFKPGEGPAATSSPLSARPGGGSDKLSDLLPPSSKARTQARTGDVDLSNGVVWDSLFNSGKAGVCVRFPLGLIRQLTSFSRAVRLGRKKRSVVKPCRSYEMRLVRGARRTWQVPFFDAPTSC